MLVLPPFFGGDLSTLVLRRFLSRLGYATSSWGLGRNLGPAAETVEGMVRRVQELRSKHQRKVSLVGWSLGGVNARELARGYASNVRQVITLASPFRDIDAVNVPRFMRVFGDRRPHEAQAEIRDQMDIPPPVPTTAIYSRSDGIVAWRSCVESPGPHSENIELEASHIGIGHHPGALLAVADRLAQAEENWKPFEPPTGPPWPIAARPGLAADG